MHTTEMRLHRPRADTCTLDRSRALRRQGSPSLLQKAAKLPIHSVAAQRYRSSYTSARLKVRAVRVLTCRRLAPGPLTSRFAIVCFGLCGELIFVVSPVDELRTSAACDTPSSRIDAQKDHSTAAELKRAALPETPSSKWQPSSGMPAATATTGPLRND